MEQEKLVALIKKCTRPNNRYYTYTSYALKEVFEKLAKDYIPEKQFKDAMKQAGYSHRSVGGHHRYKIIIPPYRKISKFFWGIGSQIWKY